MVLGPILPYILEAAILVYLAAWVRVLFYPVPEEAYSCIVPTFEAGGFPGVSLACRLVLSGEEMVFVTLSRKYAFKRSEVTGIEEVRRPLAINSKGFRLYHSNAAMPSVVIFDANWWSVKGLAKELERLKYPLMAAGPV